MEKYWFFTPLFALLLLACGGPKATGTTETSVGAPREALPGEVGENPLPTVAGDEAVGPNLPPEIPETVYAPFLRRANTPAPPIPAADNTCFLPVEVRNYDGLDGCGFLLETDDGSLLALGNVPRGEPLQAGARIIVGFDYMRNADPGSCSNADAVVYVTCMRTLRVTSGLPRPVVCEAYDKPSQWLHDLATNFSATYVTRFPWKDGRYVYLLETPYGQYLYDCRGYMICKPRKNCLGFIEDYRSGVVIFEGS